MSEATLKERAKIIMDEILDRSSYQQGIEIIERALNEVSIAAIKAEREASAMIVDARMKMYQAEGNMTLQYLFKYCADEIRARS